MRTGAVKQIERPAEACSVRTRFRLEAQVPLADRVRVIAGIPQQPRKRHNSVRQTVFVTRNRKIKQPNPALSGHARHMVIIAAQQHGARRCAIWRSMKLREQHTLRSKCVDIRCLYVAAVDTEIGVSEIVRHEQKDIRGIISLALEPGLAGRIAARCAEQEQKERKTNSLSNGHVEFFSNCLPDITP